MTKYSLVLLIVFCTKITVAQNKSFKEDAAVKSAAAESCACVDSINNYNKTKAQVAAAIHECIKKQVVYFQISQQVFRSMDLDSILAGKASKDVQIAVDDDETSPYFKKYYYEIERYMRDSCAAMDAKMASNELINHQSVSEDRQALRLYDKGLEAVRSENLDTAITYFEKALIVDQKFAFAWDNLGLCYRKKGDYDAAIRAYQKSLSIDPKGVTPLQNIAVAYQFKKQYDKAIDAFKVLETVDSTNPEVYYGIGRTYAVYMGELEKGLDYMCKAHNLYVEQKSPYRTDAEQVMSQIYRQMEEKGNAEKFAKILKENNISISDE